MQDGVAVGVAACGGGGNGDGERREVASRCRGVERLWREGVEVLRAAVELRDVTIVKKKV